MNESPDNYGLNGRGGWFCQNAHVYDSTNQVQRIAVAKRLRK